MNKLKFLKIIIGLLIVINANAETPINLCLTGKIETILPNYKIAFLNGVKLALTQKSAYKAIHLKTYFFDAKPLSAIRAYNKMLSDNCSAIVGFEYLSDLLLVIKKQSDDSIPIFTSYPSSNNNEKFPKNIFIFAPSYDYQAKKMIDFMQKRYRKITDGLIATEIDRADLLRYKIAYKKILSQNKVNYEEFDFIENDSRFEKKLKKFVSNKNYNFVFVFAGAVGSTKILNFMNNHKTIFIGTENFGSSTNQSLYVRLNDKNIKALIIRNIDFLKTNNQLKKFAAAYTNKYKIPPSPLSVYAYDATSIILKSIEREGSVRTDKILNIDYNGITGAYIKKNQFHRSNQYVILSIKKHGFFYEE